MYVYEQLLSYIIKKLKIISIWDTLEINLFIFGFIKTKMISATHSLFRTKLFKNLTTAEVLVFGGMGFTSSFLITTYLNTRFQKKNNLKQIDYELKAENFSKQTSDEFWVNYYRSKREVDDAMHVSNEFMEDYETCIRDTELSNDGKRYIIKPGNYTHNAYDCAKYKYILRTRECSCGNPEAGIEGSNHSIFGCQA